MAKLVETLDVDPLLLNAMLQEGLIDRGNAERIANNPVMIVKVNPADMSFSLSAIFGT